MDEGPAPTDRIRLVPKTEYPQDSTTYGPEKLVPTEPSKEDLSEQPISTRDLYPLHSENLALSVAFQLLTEGIKYLNDAIKMLDEKDLLASDDALQQFQAVLPELFCCRDIGDGFGTIVNSIFHSLKNLAGAPLTKNQLEAILKIVRRIYTEPYIGFDEAVEEVMSLEEVGLEVEPSYLKFAADMLNE